MKKVIVLQGRYKWIKYSHLFKYFVVNRNILFNKVFTHDEVEMYEAKTIGHAEQLMSKETNMKKACKDSRAVSCLNRSDKVLAVIRFIGEGYNLVVMKKEEFEKVSRWVN